MSSPKEELLKLKAQMDSDKAATDALESLPIGKPTPPNKKPVPVKPEMPAGGIYDKNEKGKVRESEVDAVKRMQKGKR